MKFVSTRDFYVLFVIMLIRAVGSIPSVRLRNRFIMWIGVAAFHVSCAGRRIRMAGIAEQFGGALSNDQIGSIVKRTFIRYWREVFALVPVRTKDKAFDRVQVDGIEHLQNALQAGTGVILWESNSFGARLFTKQILHNLGFSVHQVHSERHYDFAVSWNRFRTWVRQHIINPTFDRWERRFVTELIYLSQSDSLAFTRLFRDRLGCNAIICSPGDGRLGQKTISCTFLGRERPFPSGMVNLAKLTGASILPMFCVQDVDGNTHLIIEPAIKIDRGHDRESQLRNSVGQYVRLLESYIERYPDQYFHWRPLTQNIALARNPKNLQRNAQCLR